MNYDQEIERRSHPENFEPLSDDDFDSNAPLLESDMEEDDETV